MGIGINLLGNMDNSDGTLESANRVYDKWGCCPTIPTASGGGHIPKIIETKDLTRKDEYKCLSRAEQSRAEQSRAEQLLNPSSNERRSDRVYATWNSGLGISKQYHTQRKGDRQRTDLSNLDNGEYP